MTRVDVTFRNVGEEELLEFKAEAVRKNKTFGEAVTEALGLWVQHEKTTPRHRGGLLGSKSLMFKSGIRNLSQKVDEIVYTR